MIRGGNWRCQSCGMPLEVSDDFGTTREGLRHHEYCRYCFKDGQFTDPTMDMDQMIARASRLLATHLGVTEKKARSQAQAVIPRLKRWALQPAGKK